jgi:carbon monoxide dehydrogenase subunit G
VKLDGSAVLHGLPDEVWAVITDPAVLARTIPGCETLEQVGDDSYRMNVAVGVGAIRGSYAGEVHLTDQQRPASYVMHASGAGAPGQVRATVTINLEPNGEGTALTYSADAVVGGPVAGVGQRMISGVAKRMAGQFFQAIDDELTGKVTPIAAAPSAGAASDASLVVGAQSAAGRTFTGKAATAGASADSQTLLIGAATRAGRMSGGPSASGSCRLVRGQRPRASTRRSADPPAEEANRRTCRRRRRASRASGFPLRARLELRDRGALPASRTPRRSRGSRDTT